MEEMSLKEELFANVDVTGCLERWPHHPGVCNKDGNRGTVSPGLVLSRTRALLSQEGAGSAENCLGQAYTSLFKQHY